jgi:hypothetical protein
MPYLIKKQGDEFCVVKEADGKSLGCHPTHKEAADQMAAIMTNERSQVTVERFHEAYTAALFERLKGHVDPTLWTEAVHYARAKAGGHAAAAANAARKDERENAGLLAPLLADAAILKSLPDAALLGLRRSLLAGLPG